MVYSHDLTILDFHENFLEYFINHWKVHEFPSEYLGKVEVGSASKVFENNQKPLCSSTFQIVKNRPFKLFQKV